VQSGKAVLYDVRTGKRLATAGDERDIVLAADLSPDGQRIALGGPGKVVRVFSVPEGKLLYELKKHTDWITALEFSPDGGHLATGDRAGGIFLWESATGTAAGNLAEHKDAITALSWRGDSQVLASSSEDGQIIVWNVADGFPLASIAKAHAPKSGPNGVLDVQFSADGHLFSVGRDNTFRTWTADGKRVGAGAPDECPLTKVAASADGKLGFAGDYQGRVLVWNATGLVYTIGPPYTAANSPAASSGRP
jgi:WD40 repeat protein